MRAINAKKVNLLVLTIVNLLVFPPSIDVICSFFAKRDRQHKCKRRNVCEQETNFERRDELRKRDEEEEQVVEELELVEEDLGDDGDWIVLGVAHFVRHEASRFSRPCECNFSLLQRHDAAKPSPKAVTIRHLLLQYLTKQRQMRQTQRCKKLTILSAKRPSSL